MFALRNSFKTIRSIKKLCSCAAANVKITKKFYSNENDDFLKRKAVVSQGVKLYPGHQQSREEKLLEEVDAKKLIEDFYGLNELEYEKEDDYEDADENLPIIGSLKRGESNAVLDVESVIKILKTENVENICCIKIPEDLNYANYMIIGTCKSAKHINTTYLNFNKIYKKFKEEDDDFVREKGRDSDKWCAIDIGNVVIHLFRQETREEYDLETLWTVGFEYDDKYHEYIAKQNELNAKLEVLEVK